ncbi:DUF6090 family protein [Aquimarina sp. ERC-38]|uniref:DUF6090 family protein n=1 Tax=Aquimarina sp. ERC-38 TaxID=2949996 RepID=UPI0022485D4D|nr:DUF6090 family protein [Aquimarina sp. ERC-38]UZO80123.1 DUF6090 family protein [Aquimarina sp. ERC-38]
MKNNFKKFLRDIIPVLIGVLLALAINNWNEERKDRKYIAKFFTALKMELKETDVEITEKIPKQKILIDTLNSYSEDETVSLLQIIEKAKGVYAPAIRLNYWKALSNTKIELLPYERLSILADIEEGKELVEYKLNKILDFIYSNWTSTAIDTKLKMKFMLEELIRTQDEVQRDIRKILNE